MEMKFKAKSVLPIVLAACVLISLGMKSESDGEVSLKIYRVGGMLGKREAVVAIEGKTPKEKQFLNELWKAQRPLFRDASMLLFAFDTPHIEIVFLHGQEKLEAGSWYRENELPSAVYNEKWYLDFRKGFEAIVEESLKFQGDLMPIETYGRPKVMDMIIYATMSSLQNTFEGFLNTKVFLFMLILALPAYLFIRLTIWTIKAVRKQ